jgi:hypothetical protein
MVRQNIKFSCFLGQDQAMLETPGTEVYAEVRMKFSYRLIVNLVSR